MSSSISGKRLKDDSRLRDGTTTSVDLGNNLLQNSSKDKIVNNKLSNGGGKKLNGRNTSGKIENILKPTQLFETLLLNAR